MTRNNVCIDGIHQGEGGINVGVDGQLWTWDEREGQVVLARSGPEAVHFAQQNEWPERLVRLVTALGQRSYRV